MTRVHLIGIGGSGLSAIALVLLESGVEVSGSDRQWSPLAQRVQEAGGQVFTGHRAENVIGSDFVVRSSAVPDDNVEVQAARLASIPVVKRDEFMAQLIAGRSTIAVAGTHGKTTTTAMIAWMLTALGDDPSYIIGGMSANLGTNAHAGQGSHFVIEADEYDRMFLGLHPSLAVVTNVEHDHPDCYPTPEDFHQAFRSFTRGIETGGVLLACADDPGAARLASEAAEDGLRVVSYGVEQAGADSRMLDYAARELAPNPGRGYTFDFSADLVAAPQAPVSHAVSLQVPGVHNVRNATAALAVAHQLGKPVERAAQALGEYRGAGRRFEVRGQAGGVEFIDDYAHHPTEIRATLAAARQRYPGRRLWAVWQPHTYSRTRTLQAEFASAFEQADQVLVTDIYAAREAPPADGFSAAQVVAAIGRPLARHTPALEQAEALLLAELQPGDVVLVLSAGDADQITRRVLAGLAAKEERAGSR